MPVPAEGLQHDVARPDRGGLQRGVGERQRGRELLEPDLLLGAPGVGGLQRRDRLQHRQHAARPVRAGAAGAAHAPAVALEEQHARRLGGLVGVLPDPAALGVGCAEGLGHGVPEGRGIERPAGLQHRQQGPGPRRTGHRPRTDGQPMPDSGRMGGGAGGADARGRPAPGGRRAWQAPCWKGGKRAGGVERGLPRRPAGPPQAGWPDSRRRRARRRSRTRVRPADGFRKVWWRVQAGRISRTDAVRGKRPGFACTISSTASSDVWCSYSERSWR